MTEGWIDIASCTSNHPLKTEHWQEGKTGKVGVAQNATTYDLLRAERKYSHTKRMQPL
jgi:hypothetical protein